MSLGKNDGTLTREQFLARLSDVLRRSGVEDADELVRLLEINLPSTISVVDRFDEIRREIRAGRLIQAIKIHRELTGLGLKESKDAVEAMRDEMAGQPAPPPEPEPPPGAIDFSAIDAAIAAGNKIEAIKLYREQTGVGLKEAKDAVEARMGDL